MLVAFMSTCVCFFVMQYRAGQALWIRIDASFCGCLRTVGSRRVSCPHPAGFLFLYLKLFITIIRKTRSIIARIHSCVMLKYGRSKGTFAALTPDNKQNTTVHGNIFQVCISDKARIVFSDRARDLPVTPCIHVAVRVVCCRRARICLSDIASETITEQEPQHVATNAVLQREV